MTEPHYQSLKEHELETRIWNLEVQLASLIRIVNEFVPFFTDHYREVLSQEKANRQRRDEGCCG